MNENVRNVSCCRQIISPTIFLIWYKVVNFRKECVFKNKYIFYVTGVASIINKLNSSHFDENDEQLFEVRNTL